MAGGDDNAACAIQHAALFDFGPRDTRTSLPAAACEKKGQHYRTAKTDCAELDGELYDEVFKE